ncbi:hypothetical protein VS868_12070 [Salinimicrobium sp. 3283s]|uniref:hypothetical protein n=1 Tax=Salinimicrobium sp. 3283s TaxID=3114359 RepID=UPI0031E740C1
MKKLLFILFFLAASGASAQKLYTNAPDVVYPILEEYVAENYLRKQGSFEMIHRLDSIVVKDIPLIKVDANEDRPAGIYKVYGYHKISGGKEWIEIDSSLLYNPRKFHATLLHELKHAAGQKEHIDATGYSFDHPIYEDLMAIPAYPYYIPDEKWQRMKKKYYDSLSKSPSP